MKSFLLTLLGLFCSVQLTAQKTTEPENPFEKKLKDKQELVYKLIDEKEKFDRETSILEVELTKLTDAAAIKTATETIENRKKSTKEKRQAIVDACADYTKYREYIEEYEDLPDAILNTYKARICEVYKVQKKELDPDQFIIIGDNEPIKKEELLSNDNTKKVLRDVFSIDSKTNLGTFEIPGNNAFINFYVSLDDLNDIARMEGYSIAKSDSIQAKLEKDAHAMSIKRYYNIVKNGDAKTKGEGGDEGTYNSKFNEEKIKTTLPANSFTGELFFTGGALFKSIQIELREGGIVDTRLVFLSQDKKTEFYFEGRYPVSILNYTRKAKESYLAYSHYVSLDGQKIYNESVLEKLLVRYVDVLDYHPNAGSNYVPDDVAYKFPSEKEAEIKDRRSYQVINNNHLQNVLDLRAYTDLLGLFSDEDNGLFQIEGKADFFINPFNVKREALYFLKKVSPYVRYSRFDNDTGFVQAEDNIVTDSDGMMSTEYLLRDNKLALLERSNLEMGSNLNLINFRWFKESPFWTSFYFPLSYNVAKVRTDAAVEDNDANYKVMGFGLGANLEIRRFNNFGLNIGYELKGHSFVGDYSEFNIQKPGYLKTQAINAEIFYYPGADRSNSIFLRMRNVRDVGSGAGDAFFQLQVGYRFTLGVGAIRAR